MTTGIARSIIASIMACVSIEASQERRRIVSGVLRRVRMGASTSSAEASKNDITVLSESYKWLSTKKDDLELPEVKNIDTCSAQTARFFSVKADLASMKAIRS